MSTVASKEELDETVLAQDLSFLLQGMRQVDQAKRQRTSSDHSARGQNKAKNLQALVKQAKRRDIKLQLLPQGFDKHEQNTSKYDKKSDTIVWHVEYSLSSDQQDLIVHSKRVRETTLVRELLPSINAAMLINPDGSKTSLCLSKTLAENLKGHTVLEFPRLVLDEE